MEFTDDLSLINNDIENFRKNKKDYSLNRMNSENDRMYVNTHLKHKQDDIVQNYTLNQASYMPNSSAGMRKERMLKLVDSAKGMFVVVIW
jgi:hypothetical protein